MLYINCIKGVMHMSQYIEPDVLAIKGEELWDMIGGEGTYKYFITEINKLGAYYKERIYREYLGIEPPEGFDKDMLK